MDKVLFALLLTVGAVGVGLAGVGAWMDYRLSKLKKDKRYLDLLFLKLGIVISQGILIIRLAQLQSADPTVWAWGYLIGLIVIAAGLARRIRTLIGELAVTEVVHNGLNSSWPRNIERRLTAEEARNTDIEEAARTAMKRADEAEKREKE